MSHPYCNCGAGVENILRCSKCKASMYCSQKCQKEQWGTHKALCSAICELSKPQERKTLYPSHLRPSEQRKLIRLVGEKCEVNCKLNGKGTEGLWDTGAQVSGLSRHWLKLHFNSNFFICEIFVAGSSLLPKCCS